MKCTNVSVPKILKINFRLLHIRYLLINHLQNDVEERTINSFGKHFTQTYCTATQEQ